MPIDDPHPLQSWLQRKNMSKMDFVKASGMSRQTIYDQFRPSPQLPRVETMQAIATATEGEVTLQDQIDWYNRQKDS